MALAFLLLANLLPLVGVFAWGWSLSDLLLLYWIENGVVGIYTVAKLLLVQPEGQSPGQRLASKAFGVPFFIVHYGMFWLVHGLFVVTLFGGMLFGGASPTIPVQPQTFFFAAVIVSWMRADVLAWPVAGLLVSHGVSFLSNYLAQGEYRRQSVNELMGQPYGRVVVLHVTILAGGFLAMLLGQSQLVLLLFVALKAVVDLWAHLREHGRVSNTAMVELDETASRLRGG